MSTSNHSLREHPSTYFVQDRSKEEEMTRLQIQDQMITAGTGGALPEQTRSIRLQRVLDVGCGTGDWLMEVTRDYPGISLLVAVDVSSNMVQYACAPGIGPNCSVSTSGSRDQVGLCGCEAPVSHTPAVLP